MNIQKVKDVVGKEYFGEIELEYKDPKTKKIISTVKEKNIIKIFAKEILTHSMVYDKIWNPVSQEWEASNSYDDFRIKYMLIGASFYENGVPLDSNDERFYERDVVTGLYKPKKLYPGADYGGSLINPIPIDEASGRPLKRIENVYFQSTYQPAGSPLLQDDVRALNNILVVETTLTEDEYNGFGLIDSDYFTITEVALAAGSEVGSVTDCDVDPHDLFLEGPYSASASGGDVITLSDPSDSSKISVGDQIKLVISGTGETDEQISPYYLVLEKSAFGSDITLDRTPVSGTSIVSGDVEIYKDTMRIFSHRILSSPAKKSSSFELTIRWYIYLT